ncbi:protein kinase domain-containing protein [Eisenibacter elegans]|jgi:serine/threonine protein kinase|uniref:protein kinase domain-containing protein n=1 Tax=Eisenibacter elegans TaxID=997 RepID=UPI0004297D72|nr:protein kinase [Eisenibacter elegans]
MIGEQLLNYRIEAVIAETPFFTTYRAAHTQYAKQVMIRHIRPGAFSGEMQRRQFDESIRLLSHIQHPNILTFYDYVENEAGIFLFLEYVGTQTLHKFIRQTSGPIPEAKALPLLEQLLMALAYAHKHQLVGGALCSMEVFMTDEGQLKISDLALNLYYAQYLLSQSDNTLVAYQAPERLATGLVSIAGDVYAAGAIAYEVLTGKPPFDLQLAPPALSQAVAEGHIAPLQTHYPAVSDKAQAVVLQALAQDSQQRWLGADAFRQKLTSNPAEAHTQAAASHNTTSSQKKQKNTQAQALDPANTRFVNLPLYVLIGLSVLSLVFWMTYNTPSRRTPKIAYNLNDTLSIKRTRDSIRLARQMQQKAESLQVAKLMESKKQLIEMYMHKVRAGETLNSIAQRYALPVDSLRSLNDMAQMPADKKLEPKMGIRVYIKTKYTVRKGETLAAIAQRFNVNRSVLIRTNQIVDEAQDITEGKVIIIPL